MTIEIKVPDIGHFKDIPVIEVLVKAGDVIVPNAPLVTLESDKAAMEVPAIQGGRVVEVRLKPGDRVSQGSLILLLDPIERKADSSPVAPAPPVAVEHPVAVAAPAPDSAPVPLPTIAENPASPAPSASLTVHAGPSVRRFARELGVDLSQVRGQGPKGRILREDVQAHVKTVLQAVSGGQGPVSPLVGLAPWPVVDFAQYGPIEVQPLSRIKKIAGANLHRNWVMIPHVTNHDETDVTDLDAFRMQLNAENGGRGVRVTLLSFMIKALCSALREFPEFNASLEGDSLILKRYYHLGFAADTPQGLMVPVIRDADRKGVRQLAEATAELAAQARDGKLPLTDMQGGTFSISSLGGLGGTYFTPIINAPEVAILGVSRASLKPVWRDGAFQPRLILPLSLSYDHRVIDGAAAARFLTYLAGLLGDLRRITL